MYSYSSFLELAFFYIYRVAVKAKKLTSQKIKAIFKTKAFFLTEPLQKSQLQKLQIWVHGGISAA